MKVFGQHDESTLKQLNDVASRAERVALMARVATPIAALAPVQLHFVPSLDTRTSHFVT